MTKCPYVPPHAFNLDFPHLMLRYRAAELKRGEISAAQRQLSETDRNGKLAGLAAPLANWASAKGNALTRPVLELVAGVDRDAPLPKFHFRSFEQQAMDAPPEVNRAAPGFGRKAVIYATCFVNYNDPGIGHAARAVLAHNGVETEIVYPACCGMPKLEHGDLAAVAESARTVSATLAPWLDRGYDVIALTPSCALMLKFEWPLILPDDAAVKRLAGASFDIPEYVVNIAKKEGLAPGLGALDGGVTVHLACHARAQNMGPKAVEMLKLIPQADLGVIERCSGHGGSWGVLKEFHGVALKVGKPAARTALTQGKRYVTSECPLAARHLLEGMRELKPDAAVPARPYHPIELLAQAYGLYP